MSLRTAPAFIGQIVVTTGLNDVVYWREDDGGAGVHDLSATLTPGTYWPALLIQHVANEMTTESGSSGNTNTYTGTFVVSTGIMKLARTGGASDWYPKVTTAETVNVLTGGVVDTTSNTSALSVGQYGANHLGWLIATSSPALSDVHTADQTCAHTWIPSLPPAMDSEEQYERTVIEAIAMDGSGEVYSFSDWQVSASEFPLYGGDWQRRTLRFDRMTQADTTWYLSQWWGPHAGAGGKFRYYPDKTVATYYTCRLTGDSMRKASRGARLIGYALWSIPLEMRRAPA